MAWRVSHTRAGDPFPPPPGPRVQRVDVFYLSTWITFFQIIIGFVLTPINSLLPPAEGGVALQNVGKQFSEGACDAWV